MSQNFDENLMKKFNENFRNYHIFFSSTIDRQNLKELAEADHQEVVQSVQEIFADFNPHGAHLFTVPVPKLNHFKVSDPLGTLNSNILKNYYSEIIF